MDVSTIAKTLYPLIGGEYDKPQDFLIALLDSVSNDEDATVFGFSDDNLRRFYNGSRTLTQDYAVLISGKLNIEKCSSFIYNRLLDDSPIALEQQLLNQGVAIEKDVSEICADLLVTAILTIASSTKAKTKKAKPKLSEIDLAKIRISNDGNFTINNEVKKFFNDLPVPIEIAADEMGYVTILLSAYANADQLDNYQNPKSLPLARQKDFKKQRENYYKAESIRRGVRDNFMPDEGVEHFEDLKNDMYDGIIEIVEDEHEDAVMRLKAVLKQSSIITLNGSILSFMPGLLGNSAKKGICHMLVNDGRISWVTKDE